MNDTQRFFVVGATLLAAATGVVLAVGYLRGTLNANATSALSVRFADARGVQTGYQVRMAGIPIGSVQDIQLVNRKAVLHLRVEKRFPIPADSTFTIVTPLIGSSPYLQVTPGVAEKTVAPGAQIDGIEGTGLDALMGKADTVMGRVDTLLADPAMTADLKRTVHNLRLASEELPRTLKQGQAILQNAATLTEQTTRIVPQLQGEITAMSKQTQQLLVDFRAAAQSGNKVLQQTEGLTKEVRTALNENRSGIKALLRNANDAVGGLAALSEQFKDALANPKIAQNLESTTANIEATTRKFTEIADKLDQSAASLTKLASDPALSEDIKATVANIRDTSASVKSLAARIETIRIPGERRRPDPADPPPPAKRALSSVAEPGLTFDSQYDTTAERLRNDAHFVLPVGSRGDYYRVGLFDATEGNLLDLQAGRLWGGGSILRYGLFAGKLGVGIDRSVGGLDLRLDLYDPNRFTAAARIKKRLKGDTSLTVGVDSLGNGNRPLIGIQVKR